MPRTLTIKILRDKHACREQVRLFRELFGDSVEITEKLCVQHAGKFSFSWAANHLLSVTAREDYDKAIAPARRYYHKTTASALEVYDKAIAAAWEVYSKTTTPALEVYDKAIAAVREDYDKTTASAWEDYNKTIEAAWAYFNKATTAAQKDDAKAVAPALKDYDKAIASAWARAYINDPNPASTLGTVHLTDGRRRA